MNIKQFPYGGDNLGYLLYTDKCGMVIDGGAVKAILAFVRENGLTVEKVTNTHGHADHTAGTREIVRRTGAEYLDHRRLADGAVIDLDGQPVTVRLTPGHSTDAVVFATEAFLVTGDTLFNGKVGKCFSGDLAAFYRSVRSIMAYPGHLRIYAGHDYLLEAMDLARRLTPGNRKIEDYANGYDTHHVVSTLADELAVNPFLRINAPDVIEMLESRNLPTATEYERWVSIMTLIE